jgi:hypothetical protein
MRLEASAVRETQTTSGRGASVTYTYGRRVSENRAQNRPAKFEDIGLLIRGEFHLEHPREPRRHVPHAVSVNCQRRQSCQ